jgi:hypothetical protein
MQQMQNLSDQSYSEEARKRLESRSIEWTEADQEQASAQWAQIGADVARLSAANADPASPEAQDLAMRHSKLIEGFTGGDPEIAGGLNKWWQNFDALPDDQKPFQSPYTKEQQAWMDKVLEVYRQRQK